MKGLFSKKAVLLTVLMGALVALGLGSSVLAKNGSSGRNSSQNEIRHEEELRGRDNEAELRGRENEVEIHNSAGHAAITQTVTAQAQLTADSQSAVSKALSIASGTVERVEQEVEDGRSVWKVRIIQNDGIRADIRLDAATLEVVRLRFDDRGNTSSSSGREDESRGGENEIEIHHSSGHR